MAPDDPVWKWGCSKCGRDDPSEVDEKTRRYMRRCGGKNDYQAFEVRCAPELERCPWSDADDRAWIIVSWWLDWQAFKALPFGGDDIMAQPAYVLEGIRACHQAAAVINKRQQEAQANGAKH